MGGQIFYMGLLGSAAMIKVITNMLAFIHLVADGEALMLAKRGGLDLAKAWQAITASSGTSFVHETEGQLILNAELLTCRVKREVSACFERVAAA
jgi:3-hydroxyisobutyrate dehydrogenase